MDDGKISVGIEIRKLDHMMKRMITYQVKEAGMDEVTLMHGWIIRYLYERKKKDVFQKDIELHFSIGRSTVTNIIQLMEKKGYIERQSVEYDARLKKVVLTERGMETHEKMEDMVKQWEQQLIADIPESEMEVFFKVVNKIKKNAGKEKDDD